MPEGDGTAGVRSGASYRGSQTTSMTIFSGAAVMLAASSSTKPATAGSSLESLLFIVVLFGALYFFFLRPRQQAARRQRSTLMELSPGDEVLTGAGIFGTVLDVENDRVTIETAPGTRITVLRSTIARRITEDASADDHDELDHHDDDDHDALDDHHDGDTSGDAADHGDGVAK